MQIENLKQKHPFTSDKKLKWFGYGEWVEEPDLVTFEYRKTKCQIHRIVKPDGPSLFGGFLSGYIHVREDHSWSCCEYTDIDCQVHWGLTYGEWEDNGEYWVGFDCSHLDDLVPSLMQLNKALERIEMPLLKDILCPKHPLLTSIYRNIEFCINQCCSLVDQMLDQKKELLTEPD